MFGLLIKKTFFDMWDNFILILILNVGFLVSLAAPLYLSIFLKSNSLLFSLILIIGIIIFFIYTGIVSKMTQDITNYRSPGIRDFLNYLKQTYPTSIFFAILNIIFFSMISITLPFYNNMGFPFGIIIYSILFWITLFYFLSAQLFFPIQARIGRGFKDSIKKMFLICIDSPGFSIGLIIGNIFIILISSFLFFLIPGPTSILLWLNVGVKLRLYKYEYLEKNPEADRKNIPWHDLLKNDKNNVGKRTFKSMIFPWKQ